MESNNAVDAHQEAHFWIPGIHLLQVPPCLAAVQANQQKKLQETVVVLKLYIRQRWRLNSLK
jgi:hypothetical protein